VSLKVLFQAFSDQRFFSKRLSPREAELAARSASGEAQPNWRAKHTGTEDLSPQSGHCDLA